MRLDKLYILLFLIYACNLYALSNANSDSLSLSKKAWSYYEYAKNNVRNSTEAMEYLKMAMNIGEKINENLIIEFSYGLIAIINTNDSLFATAISNYNNSIRYCNTHNKCNTYKWKTLKAFNYYKLKEYSIALKILSNAESEAILHNDQMELYKIYFERIRIYEKIDLFELADKTLEKLIGISKSIRKKNNGGLYRKLADNKRRKGNIGQAIDLYKYSLNFTKYIVDPRSLGDIKSYTYNKIGDCYRELNDYPSAAVFFLKGYLIADSVQSHYYSIISLLDLCELYTTEKNHVLVKKYLDRIDSLSINESQINLKIRKNIILGRIYQAQNDPDSSLFYFKKALTLFEKQINTISVEKARSGFLNEETEHFANISNIYKHIIQQEPSNFTYYDSLFKYSNIIRSRTLSEKKNYKNNLKDSLYTKSVTNLKKYQRGLRLSEFLDYKDSEVELNGLKYQLLTNKLYQLTDQIENINQISLSEFKEYLGHTNSTALIFNINKSDQYVISINNDSVKIIDLNIDIDSLSGKISYFLNSAFFNELNNKNSFNTKIAHELYCDLWQPLEKQAQLNRNIIIIPDKPILSLPFDILMEKTADKEVYRIDEIPVYTKNMLVNTYNFSILPSANLVKSFKPVNTDQLLVVSNPTLDKEISMDPDIIERTGWSFEQLLFSKSEAKSIQRIYDDAVILEAEAATFKNIKKYTSTSSIIHFSTHAFVDTIFDMFSGLVLSIDKDSTDDGFLMGYDISNLNLNCDLVTLGACESGRGRQLNNEGIMGLPRLFFAAGARSTLMSLWKVSDKLSAELIPHFYRNLIEENMSKSEALGQAKRYILKNFNSPQGGSYYSNPYFWATFNIYGDVKNNMPIRKNYSKYFYLFSIITILATIFYIRKSSRK